jgi:hypothetical protein
MAIQIRTASRKKAKLRIGFSGPSGSGKTYSALLVARGLTDSWEKVLLIDSESGRGELYSNLGAYKIISLSAPFTPESYIEAIRYAEQSGVDVIVIDSTSHEWEGKGGLLESNELLARTKFQGNTWAAWSETTPRHQKFIEAIISSTCHILTTARSKTETVQFQENGKTKVKKVGLKEIQREGFEYELTVNFTLDREGHYAFASKDNTHLFDSRDPFVLSQKTGEELKEWNEAGVDAPDPKIQAAKMAIAARLKVLGEPLAEAAAAVERLTKLDLVPENYDEIIARLGTIAQERSEAAKAAAAQPAPKAPEAPVTPVEAPVALSVAPAPEIPLEAEFPVKEAVRYVPDTHIAYPDEEINPEDIPF